MTKHTYDEKNIERFAGLAGIRKKCNIYIGPADQSGLWTIWREPGDNGIDRALAGQNSYIHMVADANGIGYWALDHGPGIPVGKKEFEDERGRKEKLSTFYVVTGLTHAGGNFSGDVISRGTHGLGIKATNALSNIFKVWTFRDGSWWYIEYAKGKLIKDVQKSKAPVLPHGLKLKNGTAVYFEPDSEIFGKHKMGFQKINLWSDLHEWSELNSFLVPKLEMHITDKKGNTQKFYSERGPLDFIDKRVKELKCSPITKVFDYASKELNVAIGFSDAEGDKLVKAYTNGLYNIEGGEHLKALFAALVKSLIPYKGKLEYTTTDLQEGVIGLINYKIAAPTFSGQTKEKLIDDRVYDVAYPQLLKAWEEFWKKNKTLAMDVVKRAAELRAKTASFLADKKLIKNVNSAKKKMSSKLADVEGKAPIEQRELYLVEGDGAGGTAKRARLKSTQAVFPLKGKPLNVMEAAKDKINKNEEIAGIFAALGVDFGSQTPINKLRYGKIVLLADPDVDGCLAPNTRILTLDGKNPTIKELADKWLIDQKPIWVYARKANGKLVPAQAIRPRKTVIREEYAHITFDDGTKLKVTTDHKFMINTKKWWKYVQAKDLKIGTSLNSLYFTKTNSEGVLGGDYLSIENWQTEKFHTRKYNRVPVHRWAYSFYEPEKFKVWKSANKGSGFGGALHINHKVAKIEFVKCKPKQFYCLTVPEIGNFFIADKEGNGIGSSNSHINCLLLTLFWKFIPDLFKQGKIFIIRTPEFMTRVKGNMHYAFTKEKLMEKFGKKIEIQHLKGYGECTDQSVFDIAMNPETRRLQKVDPPTSKSGRKEFEALMGKNPAFRKQLMGVR